MFLQKILDVVARLSELTRGFLPLWGFAGFGLLFGPGHASGQIQPLTISGPPTCADCRIERHLLATIHDSTYRGGALAGFAIVHVTSDTTFFITAGPDLDELYFADRDGTIVRRVGRSGEGPGEYKDPRYVTETDSAFVVFDVRVNRATYLTKDSLALIRTMRLPATPLRKPPVVFLDGSFLFRSNIRSRDRAGLALHAVTPGGTISHSFGPRPQAFPDRLTIGGMAASGDSAVWIAPLDRYRLELWSREGNLLLLVDRPAPWFNSREEIENAAGVRYNHIQGLYEDQDGRLWVHAIELTRAGFGRIVPDPAASASIIEVLDPIQARVLAFSRESGVMAYSAGGPGFYQQASRLSDGLLLLIDVWAAELRIGP